MTQALSFPSAPAAHEKGSEEGLVYSMILRRYSLLPADKDVYS